MAKAKKAVTTTAQRDMFPARKKMAQAEKGYYDVKPDRITKIENTVASNARALGGAIETLNKRLGVLDDHVTRSLKRLTDACVKVREETEAVRNAHNAHVENFHADEVRIRRMEEQIMKLAHAVELLTAAVKAHSGTTAPKHWSAEEAIRLDSEYNLMARADGEVDWNVLAEIHDCTVEDVKHKVALLKWGPNAQPEG